MPEHQLIEKNANTSKIDFFGFVCFWSGLNFKPINPYSI